MEPKSEQEQTQLVDRTMFALNVTLLKTLDDGEAYGLLGKAWTEKKVDYSRISTLEAKDVLERDFSSFVQTAASNAPSSDNAQIYEIFSHTFNHYLRSIFLKK